MTVISGQMKNLINNTQHGVPGEIKRREVELDPQVSPEEIMSREPVVPISLVTAAGQVSVVAGTDFFRAGKTEERRTSRHVSKN